MKRFKDWGLPKKWTHRKQVTINSPENKTDFILKLNIHRGRQVGDLSGEDIFLNDNCKTDFSDIRFTDANGNELQHYMQPSGNYELTYDNARLGRYNAVYKGILYATNISGLSTGLYASDDNGQTWKLLLAGVSRIFIDSSGYLYTLGFGGAKVNRSTDLGKTWTEVLDMSAVSGTILFQGFAEDNIGNLYIGRYQNAFDAVIYRSTDKGATWQISWQGTTEQHIHGVFVDPLTGYIYAGVDAATSGIKLIRSIDNGVTWSSIWTNPNAAFCVMVATPTRRFFAGGAYGPSAGNTIFVTEDDITFTPILKTASSVQGMYRLGNHIYASGTTYGTNIYAQIYQFELDGSNPKTIWHGPCDRSPSTFFTGYMDISSPAIPNASMERHILLGPNNEGPMNYKAARLYNGGEHYQVTCYVKIPSLPAGNTDIYIWSGNSSAATKSTISTFPNPGIVQPNPLLRLLLNEGTGTAINDASGNGRHGLLTHIEGKGSWNAFQGRRAGTSYPFIAHDGVSYNFNNGNYITIPTDATLEAMIKNFSIVCWVKPAQIYNGPYSVIRKGTGNSIWELQIRGSLSGVGFGYGNGSANTFISYTPLSVATGYWCMIGVVLDNSTPAKARLIADGTMSSEFTLTYDIIANTLADIVIGTGTNNYTGDICDIQIYPYALTELQVQELYENRKIGNGEPSVLTTLL